MIRILHHLLVIFVFSMTSLRSVSSNSICYKAKDDECTFVYNETSLPGSYQPSIKCAFLQGIRRKHWHRFGRCGFDPEDPLVPLVCCPIEFDTRGPATRRPATRGPATRGPATRRPATRGPVSGAPTPVNIALKMCEGFGTRPDDDDERDRIIFGERCDVSEFPYFVSLAYYNEEQNITFDCGGSLISTTHVLTAAHCCKNSTMPVMVRMGKTALNLTDPLDKHEKVDRKIKKVILHPQYRPGGDKYHDIALIELEDEVTFSHNVWPACLNTEKQFQEDSDFIIAGFGKTNKIGLTKKADWLMKATVEEIPLDECRSAYERKNLIGKIKLSQGITETIMCAQNKNSLADACQGDSGSALTLLKDDIYFVYGVTSFGINCATTLPSFYTRVASYIGWIVETVWPGEMPPH